jgi:hypothetical protein
LAIVRFWSTVPSGFHLMDLATATAVYCLLIAVLFLGLWIFYDRRDHAAFEHERRKSTFLCVRCERLYASAGEPDTCACPRCGHVNGRLRF